MGDLLLKIKYIKRENIMTENLFTIIEIENSLKTKENAYMFFTTKVIDDENISALFIPIALKIKLTKRKRQKLMDKTIRAINLGKVQNNDNFIVLTLCWANNICRTGIDNILNVQIMKPTQIDVEKHLFEVISNKRNHIC